MELTKKEVELLQTLLANHHDQSDDRVQDLMVKLNKALAAA